MQRLITEDSPKPRRVEAAMTITTYGRRMASTLSALAESRARDGAVMPEEESSIMLAQLDSAIASLDGAGPPIAPGSVAGIDPAAGEAAPSSSLQDAQIERLHAQLAVLERAVVRYRES